MYKDVLSSIDGITIFPIIGLVIFVSFFSFMIFHVVRMPKTKIDELEKIPLDEKNLEEKNV
ncbi:MAG: cbb3-type cytochrome c oxidase subunit 3 [Ignavibacteria bacterium]|nr:cbb3-type cytochrome c oxidase subunit 3 [Ignavibacteria bacterium]